MMSNRVAVLVCASLIAACASHGNLALKNISQESAARMLQPGVSTKADVERSLGSAKINPFDSGYEVWTYRRGGRSARWPARGSNTSTRELVILFNPAGVVTQLRVDDVMNED
jgi:hypothetical protein